MSDKYQGWNNYPTWAVDLYLSNDEGLYLQVRKLARKADFGENPAEELAESIKSFVEEHLDTILDANAGTDAESLMKDLFLFAFEQVDWLEIAESWLASLE